MHESCLLFWSERLWYLSLFTSGAMTTVSGPRPHIQCMVCLRVSQYNELARELVISYIILAEGESLIEEEWALSQKYCPLICSPAVALVNTNPSKAENLEPHIICPL